MEARFFNSFMYDMTNELSKAGMSEKNIHILSNDPELLADAQVYNQEGMSGEEYARMLLNQWSQVQKHEIRENMKSKLVKESLNEGGTYDAFNTAEELEIAFDVLESIIDQADAGKLKPDVNEFDKNWIDTLVRARYYIGRLINYEQNMYDTK